METSSDVRRGSKLLKIWGIDKELYQQFKARLVAANIPINSFIVMMIEEIATNEEDGSELLRRVAHKCKRKNLLKIRQKLEDDAKAHTNDVDTDVLYSLIEKK